MTFRAGRFRLAAAGVAVAGIMLAGCATAPAQQDMARAAPVPGVATGKASSIYAALDAGVQSYQQALQAQQQDQNGAGRDILAALDQISTAARDCARLPACDMQRVSDAYDHLLHMGDDGQADSDNGDLAGTNADAIAGESSPVLNVVPQTQRAVALLKNGGLSDLVANNDAVKAAIEEWLTQMRGQLISSYVNYQFLRAEMEPAYHKAGLPEALLFGIMAKESAGKVHAVSRAGAAGPLQFMPATAQEYGLKVVDGFDQRFDPRLEALANAAFINQQLKAFNDNLELTLAAYNAGPGFIERLAGRSSDGSFWSPRVYDALSTETREYVPMVLAAAWLFLHPERYNLKFPQIDGQPGQIALSAPASLSELTICLGQAGGMEDGWFRTLRNLNPALDPQAVQPAGTVLRIPRQLQAAYAQECAPDSRWTALADTLHAATPPPVPAARREIAVVRRYRVRGGDTLSGIARRFGCDDAAAIARANGLRPPSYMIRPGMDLRLPSCRDVARAMPSRRGLVHSYRVRSGDTLTGIAQRLGCASPDALARVNGLRPPSYMIRPGMDLRVPAACAVSAQAGARVGDMHQGELADAHTYKVQPGDTLTAIAQRFGCQDVARIAKANGLDAPYLITAGMELRLPSCGSG